MHNRIRFFLGLSLVVVMVTLLLTGPAPGHAQTPNVTLNLPAENFVGEQFCFSAEIFNTGNPGYGPYFRLILPPQITLDSATFLNLGVSTTTVGVFPPAPGNQLTDPVINQPVTGTPGYTLIIVKLPIGSVVAGGPPAGGEDVRYHQQRRRRSGCHCRSASRRSMSLATRPPARMVPSWARR